MCGQRRSQEARSQMTIKVAKRRVHISMLFARSTKGYPNAVAMDRIDFATIRSVSILRVRNRTVLMCSIDPASYQMFATTLPIRADWNKCGIMLSVSDRQEFGIACH